MPSNLTFVKLGGSLITDKRREATPRLRIIRRLAQEVHEAQTSAPNLRILMGHGSGSFGHWEANRYHTRQGVQTPEQWVGFARVGAAAARLNRIVVDAFLEAGVPMISFQPSASALVDAGHIVTLAVNGIRQALTHGLTPLVFGDIAFDRAWGGTILSTEDIFVHLAGVLHPTRILLLGNAPGVLGPNVSGRHPAQRVIPTITPATYAEVDEFLQGAASVDVTGGMADKVQRMVALVQHMPDLRIRIFTGREPGNLKRALLEPDASLGTLITT
jgi:isopentenyl phosphate kinase